MGFGIGESKSSTKVNAPVEKSPITADAGSIATRNGAVRLDTLAANASQINLGKNARLTITSDPALVQKLLNQQEQTVSDLIGSQAANDQSTQSTLSALLGKFGELSADKLTGGESSRDKTFLYIALALAAVAALWLFRK